MTMSEPLRPHSANAPWRVATVVLLAAGVLCLASCENTPAGPPRAAVVVNPYGFGQLDLAYASWALELATAAKDTLETMGELKSNIYGFVQRDIDYADSVAQAAASSQASLQQMLDDGDFSDVGDFIPDQFQIDGGFAYWEVQQVQLDSLDSPYWEGQRELAMASSNVDWIEVCDLVLGSLDTRQTMVDSMLHGLAADELFIHQMSGETVRQLVARKTRLEQTIIDYHEGLVLILPLAIELQLPDWSGLENFLLSESQIEVSTAYWNAELDSLELSRIPYWEGQLALARDSGNSFWVQFCEHTVSNLGMFEELAGSVLDGLTLDAVFIGGGSEESLQEVVSRKTELASQEIDYYSDLVDVISEGIALGILFESDLGRDGLRY